MTNLMPCPCCSLEMHVGESRDDRVHGCSTCGGVWLDTRSTRNLTLGNVSEEILDLARAVHAFAWEQQQRGSGYREPARAAPEGARRCPVCREDLNATQIFQTGVSVDVCAAHGNYFDPNEIAFLNSHFAGKVERDRAAAREFAKAVRAGDDRSQEDLKAFFRGLARILEEHHDPNTPRWRTWDDG